MSRSQENQAAIEESRTRFGKFSPEFHGRASKALELASPVVEHIASLIASKGDAGDKVDSSNRAVFPFNEQAFHDTNQVYQTLVRWAIVWGARIGIAAPRPARGAWRQADGTVVGLPVNVDPVDAGRAVAVMAGWLRLHLTTITQFDSETVLTFGDEISEVFSIDARWPRKEHARYAEVPCMCEFRGRIAIYPPRFKGDERKYTCEQCGRWFKPEDFEHLANAFEQHKRDIAKEYKRGQRVMRELAAKYSPGVGGHR